MEGKHGSTARAWYLLSQQRPQRRFQLLARGGIAAQGVRPAVQRRLLLLGRSKQGLQSFESAEKGTRYVIRARE
jgi:hypothetical protein